MAQRAVSGASAGQLCPQTCSWDHEDPKSTEVRVPRYLCFWSNEEVPFQGSSHHPHVLWAPDTAGTGSQ